MKIPFLPVYITRPKMFWGFRFSPLRVTFEHSGRDVYRWLWWNWSVDVFAQVFNSNKWSANGGDKGDNSCFWEKARIDRLSYSEDGREVATVIFPSRIEESRGHFVYALNHHRGIRKIDRFFLRVTGNV